MTHLTRKEAAKELGVGIGGVHYWAKKLGVNFRDGRKLTDEQLSAAHKAREQVADDLPDDLDCLQVGKAGEHFVCFDLLRAGYEAFPSDQGLPYDVVVDMSGRLLRVQVKTAVRPRNGNATGKSPNFVYGFHPRKRGKNGASRLNSDHADIVAFVGLKDSVAAYFWISDVAQTVSLYPPDYEFMGKYKRRRYGSIADYPFKDLFNG